MMFGGPMASSYQPLQLHFHWGKWNDRGSEQTINGERFPMEMHLVHQASSLEWGVESATSPVNTPDGLAVAAFLWKVRFNIFVYIFTKFNPDQRD
jgi:carbonic anhydrase